MKTFAVILTGLLVAIPAARAQAPSASEIQAALAGNEQLFDDSDQTLAGCSDEAWALAKHENELLLTKKSSSKIVDSEMLREQDLLQQCDKSVNGHIDDLLQTVSSLLKMEKNADSGKMTDEITEQLKYLETLHTLDGRVSAAESKIESDFLFNMIEGYHLRYRALADRYNTLATAPTYRPPTPLSCTAETHQWGWETTTDLNCR